jgi:tryptophan synthase alpha chain
MTNRIASAFKAPDGSPKKAFIAFLTCGDPSLSVTEEAVVSMAEAGADLIELGIPFSDPMAEGPTIQQANVRALKNKVTTDDIFALVGRIRKQTTIPLVFMTYANVVFSYGIERFAERSAELGVDGLILPDVPYEEKLEFSEPLSKKGLSLISLIAPTSHGRIRQIAAHAEGFVYVVSSLGVTGMRSQITTDIPAMVSLIREANPTIPCAVGFGISTPEQAQDMASKSDGAIVGSAIVKLFEKYGQQAPSHVSSYVKAMADATHSA